jgi:discs large-associated protein 1
VQDGVYFIKVLENEIFKFEEQICDWEEELNIGADIPEEARDTILTVIGMGKLLMAQKLTQFRGLCDKNIHVTREEDPFVPTNMDLAGFWDMVHIQIEQIHTRFQGLQVLKSDNWVFKVPEKAATPASKPKAKKVGGTNNKTTKAKGKSEAVKARDEARKKMLEDRKRAMKEKKAENQDDLVIIM